MQKRKEKERRELRDKAGQAQSGGGALLKDINIVGFDDIDTSQQRMTCVKCEGKKYKKCFSYIQSSFVFIYLLY